MVCHYKKNQQAENRKMHHTMVRQHNLLFSFSQNGLTIQPLGLDQLNFYSDTYLLLLSKSPNKM